MNKKLVTDEHKQVCHYTTAQGLYGILTSQQLWATHIAYLNDAEEHIGFFNRRLPKLLKGPVNTGIAEINQTPEGQIAIQELGGIEAVKEELLCDLAKSITDVTLNFDTPFITSFCSTANLQNINDGILSQWRGYGPDGGYAVIFDTKGLDELLRKEDKEFIYQSSYWGDVHYYDGVSENSHPDAEEFESIIHSSIKQFILSQKREDLEPLLNALTPLSCFHKHAGFCEENEVRIVALLPRKDLLEEIQHGGDTRREKQVRFKEKHGLLIPYIPLFETMFDKGKNILPINKIIVGPHPEGLKRKRSVEWLLEQCGVQAEVEVSNIPYLGH